MYVKLNALVPLYDYYYIMYPFEEHIRRVWLAEAAAAAATTVVVMMLLFNNISFIHMMLMMMIQKPECVSVCGMALNIICIQECVIFWQQRK